MSSMPHCPHYVAFQGWREFHPSPKLTRGYVCHALQTACAFLPSLQLPQRLAVQVQRSFVEQPSAVANAPPFQLAFREADVQGRELAHGVAAPLAYCPLDN